MIMCANVENDLTIGSGAMKQCSVTNDKGLADLTAILLLCRLIQPLTILKVEQGKDGIILNVSITLITRTAQFRSTIVNLNTGVLSVTLFTEEHATRTIHQVLTLDFTQTNHTLGIGTSDWLCLQLDVTGLVDVGIGEQLGRAIVELFQ